MNRRGISGDSCRFTAGLMASPAKTMKDYAVTCARSACVTPPILAWILSPTLPSRELTFYCAARVRLWPDSAVSSIRRARQLSGDKLRFAAWNEFLPISMPTVAMVSIDLLEMAVLL